MTMPVLFIDIDNVAHPQGASSVTPQGKLEGERLLRWAPALVQILEELPYVDVVVHPSWRQLFETDEEMQPANPTFADILPEGELEILGVVVARSARIGGKR